MQPGDAAFQIDDRHELEEGVLRPEADSRTRHPWNPATGRTGRSPGPAWPARSRRPRAPHTQRESWVCSPVSSFVPGRTRARSGATTVADPVQRTEPLRWVRDVAILLRLIAAVTLDDPGRIWPGRASESPGRHRPGLGSRGITGDARGISLHEHHLLGGRVLTRVETVVVHAAGDAAAGVVLAVPVHAVAGGLAGPRRPACTRGVRRRRRCAG